MSEPTAPYQVPRAFSVAFTVLGRAQPAGSKKAFALKSGGVYTGRVVVTDDAKGSRAWKQEVAGEARRAMFGHELLLQAMRLEVVFYVRRPQGHYGSGRNGGVVRASAPAFPAVKPDLTKLVRGLEDALTGIVWRDDAQVVQQLLAKRYGEPERAEVRVVPVSELPTALPIPKQAALAIDVPVLDPFPF